MTKYPTLIYPENVTVLYYVTVFESRNYQVQTRDGYVGYEDWLVSEGRRVSRAGPVAIIRRQRDKQIALALIKLPPKA